MYHDISLYWFISFVPWYGINSFAATITWWASMSKGVWILLQPQLRGYRQLELKNMLAHYRFLETQESRDVIETVHHPCDS
jgi:hypothetical protein